MTQEAGAFQYQYMAAMDTAVPAIAIPRELEREEERSSLIFREIVAAIVMFLVPVITVLVCNCVNVQEEYAMQGLRARVMTMAKENAVAKLEVSRLDAPVRIETIAEKELGMTLPVRAVYGADHHGSRTLVAYNGD